MEDVIEILYTLHCINIDSNQLKKNSDFHRVRAITYETHSNRRSEKHMFDESFYIYTSF